MSIDAMPRLDSQQGWLTYELFYGLREQAFSLSSDPSFFYNSASHSTAFDELLSGIRRCESLSMLSGGIGTGKTTLCRTVLKSLDRQTFSAFVADPFASREDLLKVILANFGVVSVSDLTTGRLRGASRIELSFLLHEFLATLSSLQAFAVVFIDEAQNLSLPLLEEIRILADSDGRERQLQVVLVGQPALRGKLHLPEMRQVSQRIAVRCMLVPLDREGVEDYVAHRLHVAGGAPDRVRFSRDAIDVIFDAAGGIPRVINGLCDRALHHGYLQRIAVIDRVTATLACADLDIDPAIVTGSAPAPCAVDIVHPPVDSTEAFVSELNAYQQSGVENEQIELPDVPPVVTSLFASISNGRDVAPPARTETPGHRWLRRAKIAVVTVLILGGAGVLGATLAARTLMRPVQSPQVASPRPPALPAALVIPPVPDDIASPLRPDDSGPF